MYDKLIKRLREAAISADSGNEISESLYLDILQACDAIEELQKRVPKRPHGRLIDADALKVSLAFAEKTAEWAVPALRAVLMVIDEMPNIIPAEEGE